MNTKIIMSVAFFVCVLQSNAQQKTSEDQTDKKPTVFSGILSVNNWIKKLTAMYKDLVSEEKKDECILKLGYLGSDLEYISVIKKKIILSVEKGETNDLYHKIDEIYRSTNDLVSNIQGLSTLVNDNLGKLGNIEMDRIQNELLQEKMKMHILMARDAKSSDFKKLKTDTAEAIQILDRTKFLVWQLRDELLKMQ